MISSVADVVTLCGFAGFLVGFVLGVRYWKRYYRLESILNHLSPTEIVDWGFSGLVGAVIFTVLGVALGGIVGVTLFRN